MSRNVPLIRWLVSNVALAGVALACAGRVDLPMMWAYLGVYFGLGLLTALIVDASLDAERRQPGPGAIDLGSRPAASSLFLATVAIAVVDAGRCHWTQAIPWAVQFAALVVFTLASAVQTWAMAANPFFSSAIRIQSERGQRVMTDGPYRVIRHPGYLGMMIIMPATAVALGSLVSLVPVLCYSSLILWRVLREDQFLRENLRGYSGYAGTVRYRLIPGIW